MRILIPALCIHLAVCTFACAQQLPNPKPGRAHKLFAKDVGTWDCKVKMFFEGPDKPPTESKGTEVNKLVSGDLYAQTAFKCEMVDRIFEGHSLMGYDPRSKKYVGTWVDNFTSIPTKVTGQYDEQKNIFTAHSIVVDAASGRELKQKQVTTWFDDSNKKFEIFLLLEAGDNTIEIKLMEMTAKKRKN